MKQSIIKPRQGIILISEPSLQDFYFRQAIVLLAEHNEEGTFGVIINKPIEVRLPDVVKDFPDFDCQLFLGGPVKTDSLFFIHTRKEIGHTMEIMKGLYWGGDLNLIREMIEEGKISVNEIRFYVGYSGWHPNQLDREINEKSWILSHASIDEVINNDPEKLWKSHLKSMGKDYAIWANFPNDPSLN